MGPPTFEEKYGGKGPLPTRVETGIRPPGVGATKPGLLTFPGVPAPQMDPRRWTARGPFLRIENRMCLTGNMIHDHGRPRADPPALFKKRF